MNRQDVEKALKRVHYLRILNRVNRITGVVRKVCALIGFFFLAINLISVIKMLPER